jgi:hypothetical protein
VKLKVWKNKRMKMWDGRWNAYDVWNTIEEIVSDIRHREIEI